MKILMAHEHIPIIENLDELSYAYYMMRVLNSESVLADNFSPEIIDLACSLGFLPMATIVNGEWYLYLKHHTDRCIMNPSDMIIKKKIINLSREYEISINSNFDFCINEINRTYNDSWLCKKLTDSYKKIFYGNSFDTKFYSFELKKEGKIVAGEIGYAVGGCYTSLSGYHTINHSGNIQLAATSVILKEKGFGLWDLGMELPYKLTIGAKTVKRTVFTELFLKEKEKRAVIYIDNPNVFKLLSKNL